MQYRWPRWWDFAIAALAAVALVVDGARHEHAGVTVGSCALAALTSLPLAWRRRRPLAVLLAVTIGVIACVATFEPADVAVPVLMIPLYAVADLGDRRRSLIVGAVTAVVVVAAIMVFQSSSAVGPEDALRLVLALGALVVGDAVRTRRELAAAARARSAQEGQRRMSRERLRIARELHDTLAHALVAINVRAGVAVHLAKAEADTEALSDIKGMSAQALGDLRATLDLLREEQDAAPTGPAPDLAAVSELIESAKAAGVDASAEVSLNGTTIPSAVGQAGFRIVQEALTNVLRHSGAASARVSVNAVGDALEIDVTDDGRGGMPSEQGHGLKGMVERAVALGGGVVAGPRPDGGWRVHAHLPLGGEPR